MPANIRDLMKIDVPIIVRMGEKTMKTGEVTALQPGSIIELPKSAEEPLELLVNNKCVGTGSAVKVGENFGIRLEFVGDLRARIQAMGDAPASAPADESEADADALAEQLLAAQGIAPE